MISRPKQKYIKNNLLPYAIQKFILLLCYFQKRYFFALFLQTWRAWFGWCRTFPYSNHILLKFWMTREWFHVVFAFSKQNNMSFVKPFFIFWQTLFYVPKLWFYQNLYFTLTINLKYPLVNRDWFILIKKFFMRWDFISVCQPRTCFM